jgi:hypothetical protein
LLKAPAYGSPEIFLVDTRGEQSEARINYGEIDSGLVEAFVE